jgi:hypothetical protein
MIFVLLAGGRDRSESWRADTSPPKPTVIFDRFRSPSFADPQLGEFRRSSGMWRGSIVLGSERAPLVVSGTRVAPDPEALIMARGITSNFPTWRDAIYRALFEHYLPYAQAVTAGEKVPPKSGLLAIDGSDDVWAYATPKYVNVAPLGGPMTVEIGYRVTWDEEHTLGARLRDGEPVELCGSVLAP